MINNPFLTATDREEHERLVESARNACESPLDPALQKQYEETMASLTGVGGGDSYAAELNTGRDPSVKPAPPLENH